MWPADRLAQPGLNLRPSSRRGSDQIGARRPDSVVLGSSASDGAAETAPHLPALPDVGGRLPWRDVRRRHCDLEGDVPTMIRRRIETFSCLRPSLPPRPNPPTTPTSTPRPPPH